MKFQVLIPQYHETDDVVKPLLDSIALQQNVPMDEIGAIICNDGSDVFLTDEFLNSYPFKVEYYKEPHRGVSGTRNACLDHATAEYVMFCDADDMFYSMCGLWILFREMSAGFDSLVSAFVEETRRPEGFGQPPKKGKKKQKKLTLAEERKVVEYVNHDVDSTFVHGKVHRRQYLIDKNIRWNEKLTIHEDSYFNILCQNLSKNVKYCPTPFYLWKWRDDSVCRHDPKYILKTYRNMLDSNEALVKEFMSRGIHDKSAFYATFMIFDAYYTMNKEEWMNQENQEYRHSTELRFKDYFLGFKSIWENIPINDKMIISNQVRSRSVMEGMRMEAITIDDWLRHIETLEE